MAHENRVLSVVPIPGLRPDSLGNYLASLGLLRILARRWPRVRGAWNQGALCIVGGPKTSAEIAEDLCDLTANCAWTSYEREWAKAQKESTKKKSGVGLALWQALTHERNLELFAAHAVPADRISFNPLLGSGGNAGKRDFAIGWKRALDALTAAQPGKGAAGLDRSSAALKDLLLGDPMTWMVEKLNAASWFSETNKIYNSGQGSFREGVASPWSMVLGCEGLAFFAGGASRRLGSRTRVVGAFPFITRSAAPVVAGEAGHDLAEVWAPLWERPMTVPEVVVLFSRGRAEAGGRGALTPSAFATAVMRRGVDAGILEFRRFVLGRTTSANTFESRFAGAFRVRPSHQVLPTGTANSPFPASIAVERLLALTDSLPRDTKKGQRWRFVGLRGVLEAALLRVAAAPSNSESALGMLDAAVSVLDRVDRNKTFRERCVSWQPLPIEWLPDLFADAAPGPEARLALAAVSAFPVHLPFAHYRFGVDPGAGRRLVHSKPPPTRWIWGTGSLLPAMLFALLHRRTLDWEKDTKKREPIRLVMPAALSDVQGFLSGSIDDELLGLWMSRLALFDWYSVPQAVRSLTAGAPEPELRGAPGSLCMFGLFQPLFDLRPISASMIPGQNLLPVESKARTPGVARAIVSMLRVRDVGSAVRLAGSRYAMAGAPLLKSNAPWDTSDAERLAASLVFSVFDHQRAALVGRWLRPERKQGEQTNV